MEKNIFLAIALSGCGPALKAQNGNARVRYTADKTESFGAIKCAGCTRNEKVMVELSKAGISIVYGDNLEDALIGSFTNVNCLWKEAFTSGKTIIDTTLTNAKGSQRPSTVTIEGCDGNITILLEPKGQAGCKQRLIVNKQEELN